MTDEHARRESLCRRFCNHPACRRAAVENAIGRAKRRVWEAVERAKKRQRWEG